MGSSLFPLLLALFLVFLNGFFVAAEFSLVKLRQTRVKAIAKKYGWQGEVLARVHGQLDAYLSACQLGITLASLGLGWIGEPAFATLLEPLFSLAGVTSPDLVHGISFLLAFSIISFLHIVVGELAPKSLAIRRAESIALLTAVPLYGFYWLMYPAIWLLNQSANLVLRVFRLDADHSHDSHYTTAELKLIMRNRHAPEEFTKDEWQRLAYSVDFGNIDVADLMQPFREAVTLSAGHSVADGLEYIARHRYSRYPYMHEDGTVAGLVYLKDIFLAQQTGKGNIDFEVLKRPLQLIPPDMPAMELFRRFRNGLPHFAIIGHAGQPPVGFITLDNILGALVGDIRDEFHQSSRGWTRLDDGSLLGKGSLPIVTLEQALGIDVTETEEVDSVGGLIMWKLGNLPHEGESVGFAHFDAVVKRMDGPRIQLVRIIPHRVVGAAQ
ncbi:MAG: HlyC/CorC family transporter [Rhodocyclaceae bacterium]|nr:HlyC/CorC family transporter [Rhodocyclaceae bacterium]